MILIVAYAMVGLLFAIVFAKFSGLDRRADGPPLGLQFIMLWAFFPLVLLFNVFKLIDALADYISK